MIQDHVKGRGDGHIWSDLQTLSSIQIKEDFSKNKLSSNKLRQRRTYSTKEGTMRVFECTYKECPKQYRIFKSFDAASNGVLSEALDHVHDQELNYTSSSTLGLKREAVEELILRGCKKPKSIVQFLENSENAVSALQVLF